MCRHKSASATTITTHTLIFICETFVSTYAPAGPYCSAYQLLFLYFLSSLSTLHLCCFLLSALLLLLLFICHCLQHLGGHCWQVCACSYCCDLFSASFVPFWRSTFSHATFSYTPLLFVLIYRTHDLRILVVGPKYGLHTYVYTCACCCYIHMRGGNPRRVMFYLCLWLFLLHFCCCRIEGPLFYDDAAAILCSYWHTFIRMFVFVRVFDFSLLSLVKAASSSSSKLREVAVLKRVYMSNICTYIHTYLHVYGWIHTSVYVNVSNRLTISTC